MTLLTVKPENGRFATPRFSNLFDSFFENEFQNVNRKEFFKTPALVNVKDTEAAYIIDVAAPGFNKEEISIKVENNLLTIKAEQKNETETKEEKYTRKEFNFSSFNRSFTLPKTVEADKIGAAYENGILSVTLPKKEEAKPTAAIDIKIS
mgnify:CR=1 FL=1